MQSPLKAKGRFPKLFPDSRKFWFLPSFAQRMIFISYQGFVWHPDYFIVSRTSFCTGEMAHWLRENTVFLEDQSLVLPRTFIKQLTAPKDLTPSAGLHRHRLSHIHIQNRSTHTHNTYIYKFIFIHSQRYSHTLIHRDIGVYIYIHSHAYKHTVTNI